MKQTRTIRDQNNQKQKTGNKNTISASMNLFPRYEGPTNRLPKAKIIEQSKNLKEKQIVQKKRRNGLYLIIAIMFLMMGATVGLAVGIFNYYLDQLPTIPYLEDYRPWMPSRMYSGDGRHILIADFFSSKQNREMVPLSAMPKHLINAVIAKEDIRFYNHFGISLPDVMRAAYVNIKSGRIEEGASTITIQLAEDLIKNEHLPYKLPKVGLRSYTQKVYEALLALQIEKRYTKDEILEIYLNQVFLGGNIYGIARAAESYFNKSVSELTLKECALFAGMLQLPNRYSPVKSPELAQKRTETVLRSMLREGFITEEQLEQAVNEPFQLNTTASRRTQIALFPYFSWGVVRQFEEHEIKGEGGVPLEVYGRGYDIETTIDVDLQKIAEEALRHGIEEHERYRRTKGGKYWGSSHYRGVNRSGPSRLQVGEEYDARIVSEYDQNNGTVQVVVPNVAGGNKRFTVPIIPDQTWYDDFDILHPDHYIRVKVTQAGGDMQLRLAEDHYVQGGLIVVQPSTGRIMALVGGYDFYDRKNGGQFIRPLQATTVQPGSAFKPLLYTAALADPQKNWTVASILKDVEKEYWTDWTPRNFYNEYFGDVTLQYSLIHSLNAASVWLLDNIRNSRSTSIQTVKNFCRDVFDLKITDSNLSIALGTSGTSPYDLAQAYAVLANNGDFAKLHMVEKVHERKDMRREHQDVLYEFKQTYDKVKRLKSEVAYLATYLLRGVVEEGTGEPAKDLPFYSVGKTGTTDDCTYAWFAGYSKDILCIVYLGYDDFRRSLGVKRTGSQVALPVWIEFMERAYALKPELFGKIHPPEGIQWEPICKVSNCKATESCPVEDVRPMPFIEGTAPTLECPAHGKQNGAQYRQAVDTILMNDSNLDLSSF